MSVCPDVYNKEHWFTLNYAFPKNKCIGNLFIFANLVFTYSLRGNQTTTKNNLYIHVIGGLGIIVEIS